MRNSNPMWFDPRMPKRAGFQPAETDRQSRIDKRQRELEAEIRSLRKQLAEKDEVIDVLKKSVGIFSKL